MESTTILRHLIDGVQARINSTLEHIRRLATVRLFIDIILIVT
jgi:hypothetical protein